MSEETSHKTLRLGYAEYSEDGSITICGDKDGYPRFTGVIPAPDVNTKTPEIRLERHKKYVTKSFYMDIISHLND